jgi:xylan 1,4-beta-xylosidase
MATLNDDSVQVLVWNYHDAVTTAPDTSIHLTVQVPTAFGSNARVSHLRVDDSHGDAFTVWQAQGMPANPDTDQVAALERAMHPSPVVPESDVHVSADGTLSLDFELPRFGLSLVTIAR